MVTGAVLFKINFEICAEKTLNKNGAVGINTVNFFHEYWYIIYYKKYFNKMLTSLLLRK
jgi:hypothetical protein